MKRASAPTYDLFKLIVTLILAVILLLMLLRGCAGNVAPASPTATLLSPGGAGDVTLTETAVLPDTEEAVTPTALPPTAAATQTATAIEPTAALTSTPASADITPTVEATASPASIPADATATPVAAETPPAGEVACNTASPSRLAVGQEARVIQRLNMRSEASIDAPLIQTNPTGMQVEIIGGPVCTPVGERAYLWWQIRLEDGGEGWSAETPLNQSGYFLEPIS